MKKLLSFILCIITVLSLFSGCIASTDANGEVETKEEVNNGKETEEPKKESETVGVITSEIYRDVNLNENSAFICHLKDFIIENNINIFDIATINSENIIEEFVPQFANPSNDSYSVAKVFTLTAIGKLVDEGKLNTSDLIYTYFEEDFPKSFDEKWKTVTVENVIAHKMGIGEGCLDIDTEYITQKDFLSVLFKMEIVYEPGTKFVYSDGAYYLLSRLVSKITGENLDKYLMDTMLNSMGVQEAAFSICPEGYSMGATGLYIRARDIAKLGKAYVNEGKYGKSQYFSADWANYVLSNGYELGEISEGVYCKTGMYGQALVISKNNNFAVAFHGFMHDDGYQKLIDYIVDLDKKITAGELEF